jgi:EpsI family protein
MSLRLRLALVALALLLPGQLLVVWAFAEGPSLLVPASALPAQVGAWSGGADERLDPGVFQALGPSSYVARTYTTSGRPSVGLYVGFYSGRAGQARAAHDPEVCYPAAGWETVATNPVEVPLPGGDSLRAQLLEAHLGAKRQLVLYWFQPAARWPQGVVAEEIRFILDAVVGRPQYAFVRLIAAVPEAASRAEILDQLIVFASELAWPVRSVVSGDQAATATCSERASA